MPYRIRNLQLKFTYLFRCFMFIKMHVLAAMYEASKDNFQIKDLAYDLLYQKLIIVWTISLLTQFLLNYE